MMTFNTDTMAKRKAKWAIWSVGNIANRVAVEMAESNKLEVAAVCSSNLEKAMDFIARFGFSGAVAYTDIEEVLKRNDIDIVYVSSPPFMHKEHSCRCLNAGKAVLCEKPLTLNLRDAEEIFACAEMNGVFMAEGVWCNYFPAMKKMREWIDSGRIGEVIEVISTFGFSLDSFGTDETFDPTDMNYWGARLSTGGGSLAQFGCYCVNAAQFVFGQEPDGIIGVSKRMDFQDGCDQTDVVTLTYQDKKQHAMLSCSIDGRTMSETVVSGTKGNIVIGNPFFAPFSAKLYTSGNSWWYNELEEEFTDHYGARGREGFRYQFDAISGYVLEGRTESPEVSHQYSLQLARTMDRIRKELGLIF